MMETTTKREGKKEKRDIRGFWEKERLVRYTTS